MSMREGISPKLSKKKTNFLWVGSINSRRSEERSTIILEHGLKQTPSRWQHSYLKTIMLETSTHFQSNNSNNKDRSEIVRAMLAFCPVTHHLNSKSLQCIYSFISNHRATSGDLYGNIVLKHLICFVFLTHVRQNVLPVNSWLKMLLVSGSSLLWRFGHFSLLLPVMHLVFCAVYLHSGDHMYPCGTLNRKVMNYLYHIILVWPNRTPSFQRGLKCDLVSVFNAADLHTHSHTCVHSC